MTIQEAVTRIENDILQILKENNGVITLYHLGYDDRLASTAWPGIYLAIANLEKRGEVLEENNVLKLTTSENGK